MSTVCFESDQELLFQVDQIKKDRWYNAIVKQQNTKYELWLSEWNPLTDQTKEAHESTYMSLQEAKSEAIKLASELNKIAL